MVMYIRRNAIFDEEEKKQKKGRDSLKDTTQLLLFLYFIIIILIQKKKTYLLYSDSKVVQKANGAPTPIAQPTAISEAVPVAS
jgi:hypothetical protein